jgi:hypothetical protein
MEVDGESKRIKAVRKQVEKGDKLWQERYGKKEGDPEPVKPTEPPVSAEPPATPPVDPTPPEPPKEPEPVKVEPTPPTPDYKAMYEKSSEESKSLKGMLETEKQKFSTLQGKYNAEVPRMQYQINTLMDEMKKVQEQPPPAPSVPKPGNGKDTVKLESIQSLKADFPELYVGINSLVHEVGNSLLEPLIQKITKLEEETKKVEVETVRSKTLTYEQGLDQECPGWKELNLDPKFISWLGDAEPNGRIRQEMLIDAYQRRDVKGTAYYFKSFQKSVTGPEPPVSPEPPSPVPPVEPQKTQPTSLPMGGSPPATPAQGETFTREDYSRHTMEKVKGLWRGREEEWKKKETKMLKFLTKK